MDTYTYEYGTWTPNSDPAQSIFTAGSGIAVRVKITHGTVDSPAGIANKTLQDSTVYDSRGCRVYLTQAVYTADGYETFAWTANTFDELRRRISERKSNNELTEYTWNCCQKTSETLPDGTQYTYVYDDLKRLISKTKVGIGNQPDLVTTYQYDAANRKISETIIGGELSTMATWEYNLAGQLEEETNHQGLITTYAYVQGVNSGSNCKGKTTTITNPGGFTTIEQTYCSGQLSAMTGTAQVSEYYDIGVNEDGSLWNKTYIGGANSLRWIKKTTNPLYALILFEKSGFNGTIRQEFFYNSKKQLIKMTKTGVAATLYEYDSLGSLIRKGLDIDKNGVLDIVGNDRVLDFERNINATWDTKITKIYGENGSATATVNSVQKQRMGGWTNNLTQEIQEIDIHGNTIIMTQEINRLAKKQTINILYPNSNITEQTIIVNGVKQSTRTPSNLTINYEYDGLERLVSITKPRIGTSSITYHNAAGKKGLIATIADAIGNTTTYDYDTVTGRLLWKKNALNQYIRYAYNNRGQVIHIWGDVQYPVEFDYDLFGQQTTMRTFRTNATWNGVTWPTEVTGELTTWTFDDASGLITAKTDAANKSVIYAYSIDGKLTKRTWARGTTTNYFYDVATGELINIDYENDTTNIAYTYNRLGQVMTIQDAAGTRSFLYNNTFDLVKETITGIYSKELNYTYTDTGMRGQPLSLSIGNAFNHSYNYDSHGRLNKITTPMGEFNYVYLPNSDLIAQMTRPNMITTTWEYEQHHNIITQVNNGNINIFDYTNNALGNHLSMRKSGVSFSSPETITYAYNARNEIIAATSNQDATYNSSYSYDSIGNRLFYEQGETTTSYTTNILNQYILINTEQPTYDPDGNMLTRNGWTQVWNEENRLIEITNDNERLTFTYDYMGRRIEKNVCTGY